MKINSLLNQFILKNNIYWTKSFKTKFPVVLIDGFALWATSVNQCARVGKVIENKYGYRPLVIFNKRNANQKFFNQMFKSYAISQSCFLRYFEFNLITLIHAVILLLKATRVNKKRKLIDWDIKGVKIGQIIYDSCLARRIKLKSIAFYVLFFTAFVKYISFLYILKIYNVGYVVLADKEYITQGILFQLAVHLNIPVIISGTNRAKKYNLSNFLEAFLHPGKSIDEIIKLNNVELDVIKNHLSSRMFGLFSQHDVKNAYHNKRKYQRVDLKHSLGIENELPIVFIYPHVFSDCPHNTSYLLFEDYFDWFSHVLYAAKENQRVNFIVKPHPSAYMYGENDEVIKYLNEVSSDNIFLCPEDFHNLSLIDCCDLIVGGQGTIVLEMACWGVPSIVAGAGYYNGYGICQEFLTASDYLNYIKDFSVEKVFKLESEIIYHSLHLYYYIYKTSIIDPIFPERIIYRDDLQSSDQFLNITCQNLSKLIDNLDCKENNFFVERIEELC